MITQLKNRIGTFTTHGAISSIDARIQMRGKRPYVVWSIYLVILCAVALTAYSQEDLHSSFAESQRHLGDFAGLILGSISVLLLAMTPALASSSVANERQKGTLDVILSGPVSALSYVTGKVLSCIKTIWLLLCLSLPIVAVGYVAGGATFVDVTATYVVIGLNALVLACISIAIASFKIKPFVATLLSYFVCVGYEIALAIGFIGYATTAGNVIGRDLTVSGWTGALLGPVAPYLASKSITLGALAIPVWIFALVVTSIICTVLCLGAASGMSRYAAKETRLYRASLLGAGYVFSLGLSFAGQGWLGPLIACLITLIAAPFYACSNPEAERKWRSTKWFSRSILTGEPSTFMPYTTCVGALVAAGSLGLPFQWSPNPNALYGALYSVVFMAFAPLLARLCQQAVVSLQTARVAYFSAVIAIVCGPFIALSWVYLAGYTDWIQATFLASAFLTGTQTGGAGLAAGLIALVAIIGFLVAREVRRSKRPLLA